METTEKDGSENVWDYLINHFVEVIVNDGIDPLKPHIIKKTGILIGTNSNFIFIRGSIKIEALAIKNIERIAELNNQETLFKEGNGNDKRN
jgi:hypothetical protein